MNNKRKLKLGDEVRVIAPSLSWRRSRVATYERARQFLFFQGFSVTFGKNVKNVERFGTASVEARLQDLHEAYANKKVRAIIALDGGYAANALLPGMDWDVIRRNPKPLIGMSDITVLVNGIFAKTGSVNYLGPTFSRLGRVKTAGYSRTNLLDVLVSTAPLNVVRSKRWERAYNKPLAKTRPWKVLQSGEAIGTVVGGNLGSLYLLQGTPYQPRFDVPTILAIEDDDEPGRYSSAREFDRRLESLLQLPNLRKNLQGVLVGRFQPTSGVTLPGVLYILRRMKLGNIPVIYDMDFGHTQPLLTLPIGGTLSISTKNSQTQIKLLKY